MISFVKTIITEFDRLQYPQQRVLNLKSSEREKVSLRRYVRKLPRVLQEKIYTADTFSTWCSSTGIFTHPVLKEDKETQKAIEESAKAKLIEWGVSPSLLFSRKEQLLRHVFNRVYMEGSEAVKQQISTLVDRISFPERMETRVRKTIQSIVIPLVRIFKNPKLRIPLKLVNLCLAFKLAYNIQKFIQEKTSLGQFIEKKIGSSGMDSSIFSLIFYCSAIRTFHTLSLSLVDVLWKFDHVRFAQNLGEQMSLREAVAIGRRMEQARDIWESIVQNPHQVVK
jgi:hypothetical protein